MKYYVMCIIFTHFIKNRKITKLYLHGHTHTHKINWDVILLWIEGLKVKLSSCDVCIIYCAKVFWKYIVQW